MHSHEKTLSPELIMLDSQHPSEQIPVEGIGSLYSSQDIQQELGFDPGTAEAVSVPLMVRAGDRDLWLVDMRSVQQQGNGARYLQAYQPGVQGFNADYLLIDPEDWRKTGGRRAFLEIKADQPAKFGREDPVVKGRFPTLHRSLSRQHFEINYAYGEGVTVTDTNSYNHTFVSKAPATELDQPAGRKDSYDNMPVLGPDSPRIKGGVYVDPQTHEQILIGDERDKRLQAAYDKFADSHLAIISFMHSRRGKAASIEERLDAVAHVLKGDLEHNRTTPPQESQGIASLGKYLTPDSVGVSKHQALVAGYYLERMIGQGLIDGQAVRLTYGRTPQDETVRARVEFVAGNGATYIVDAEQGRVYKK